MKKMLIALSLLGMLATPVFAADTINIAITGPFSGGLRRWVLLCEMAPSSR